jgi:hypothetical protein
MAHIVVAHKALVVVGEKTHMDTYSHTGTRRPITRLVCSSEKKRKKKQVGDMSSRPTWIACPPARPSPSIAFRRNVHDATLQHPAPRARISLGSTVACSSGSSVSATAPRTQPIYATMRAVCAVARGCG